MKEMFIDETIEKLSYDFNTDQLKVIKEILVKTCSNYKIEKESTELMVINNDMPDVCKTYLATRVVEGLSEKTLGIYKLRLTQFFKTVNKDYRNITANDVRLFIYKYKEERNVSNVTLGTMQTIICTFFKWANSEGYIDKDPCANLKPIKYQKKPRGHLTELELEKVREACKTPQHKAIIEVLYSTGCRVSELVNMDLKDVNFEKREILVTGKGNKQRVVYLNAKAVIALQEYIKVRKSDDGSLFPRLKSPHTRITKTGVEYIVDKIGKMSGIERHLYPHLIRHTTATIGVSRGMEIQEMQKILGHANVSTTLIYADVNPENVKRSHSITVV